MRAYLIALTLIAAPAHAEVTESNDGGFAIRNVATSSASPQQVFAALARPSLWWNGQHTYSGDAKNLTLSLAPGGCFCETVPGSGARVEHGRVVHFKPDALLRVHGAFGPLQAEGVTGSLSWEIKALPAGGSEITQTYVVGGFIRGGASKFAPLVDAMMREQLLRLKASLERR